MAPRVELKGGMLCVPDTVDSQFMCVSMLTVQCERTVFGWDPKCGIQA